MKLIADSGSSKTEWRIIDDSGAIHQARTAGLNPYHSSDEEIRKELEEVLIPGLPSGGAGAVNEVYFYGSGCVPGAPSLRMKAILEGLFSQATAGVHDDLLAVGRGLCGQEKGIISILGTGSNSGYYDGESIPKKVAALGYILGDEGSGAWIGKTLITRYLRDELDQKLRASLEDRFGLSRENVLDNVYRKPLANRYFAGFSKFVFQHIKEPALYQLVYDGFRQFLELNILKYEESRDLPVHFSGSVAFYFNTILRQAAADLSVRTGHIVEGPIAGLALYHKNSIKTT